MCCNTTKNFTSNTLNLQIDKIICSCLANINNCNLCIVSPRCLDQSKRGIRHNWRTHNQQHFTIATNLQTPKTMQTTKTAKTRTFQLGVWVRYLRRTPHLVSVFHHICGTLERGNLAQRRTIPHLHPVGSTQDLANTFRTICESKHLLSIPLKCPAQLDSTPLIPRWNWSQTAPSGI